MEADDDALSMAKFVETRDRRVFSVLYDKHRTRIFRHVRRYVRDPARAEELTQDVFIRLYRTKRYTPDTRFQTWLYTVATRVCLNELRRPEQRVGVESIDEARETRSSELADRAPTPETSMGSRQFVSRLSHALERLPDKQRAAFLLARQDGLSHEEIAQALETSVSAVKSLIHRALEGLRKEIRRLEASDAEGPPSGWLEASS